MTARPARQVEVLPVLLKAVGLRRDDREGDRHTDVAGDIEEAHAEAGAVNLRDERVDGFVFKRGGVDAAV